MTIAIAVKVAEGVVLASDSMGTYTVTVGTPPNTKQKDSNFYDKTTKIFQVHEDLLTGVVAWGSSSVVGYPLRFIVEDFGLCSIQSSSLPPSLKYSISPNNYIVKEVAEKFGNFVRERYLTGVPIEDLENVDTGFMVAGYSSGFSYGEVWEIRITKGVLQGPLELISRDKESFGVRYRGKEQSLIRLLKGFEKEKLELVLSSKPFRQLKENTVKKIVASCGERLASPPISDRMSIGNAVDLAVFLVETAEQYAHFYFQGSDSISIGGPTQVATITRSEGFKQRLLTKVLVHH
ncbi:MAG: hypothetical protein ACLQPD_35735 [Desulfomonilaceae bacterium]